MKQGCTDGIAARRLFLASASARRRELLRAEGFDFEVLTPGVEDGGLRAGGVSPGAWATALAYLKASAGLAVLEARGERGPLTVIGADTVCVLDGRIIGKPGDIGEAGEILRAFSGRAHEVVTGVALIDAPGGGREMWSDVARVFMGELDEGEIESYLASGAWRGKAGAYNLGERLGAGWPIRFEGDPTSVMGLPMERLRGRLRAGGGSGPSGRSDPCSRESTETAA